MACRMGIKYKTACSLHWYKFWQLNETSNKTRQISNKNKTVTTGTAPLLFTTGSQSNVINAITPYTCTA